MNTNNCPKLEFKFSKKPIYSFFKRFFDILLSIIAIIVLIIPFAIVSIWIFCKDSGSPLFAQERIGRNGKPFKMYKFRSMYKDAEERKEYLMDLNEDEGALFKIENDPRILGKRGKFIRKTSIDELPQLINILKGDMSIIGPRPFVPEEHKLLAKERELVRPGLSCYWQINGKNELSTEMSNYYDKKYIMDRSLWTDVKIIFKTVVVVLKNKNG